MIIVINGPPGVGKSTASRALAGRHRGTVCIHGDELRAFAPEDVQAHLGRGSTHRAGATLAAAYLAMGAPWVIFDYCFLRPSHGRYFFDTLPAGLPTRMFTLWAPLRIVEERERGRAQQSPLGAVVSECYGEMEQHLAEFGTLVDTQAQQPAAVVSTIEHHIARATPSPRGR